MSLISQASFARAVASAKSLTKGIRVTVTHESGGTPDGRGKIVGATTTMPTCLITASSEIFRQTDGKEHQAKHTLLFLERITVLKTDIFILPGGETGPILNIKGLEDSGAVGGRYFTEVILGMKR